MHGEDVAERSGGRVGGRRRIKEKLNALILRLEAFTEALSSILEHTRV